MSFLPSPPGLNPRNSRFPLTFAFYFSVLFVCSVVKTSELAACVFAVKDWPLVTFVTCSRSKSLTKLLPLPTLEAGETPERANMHVRQPDLSKFFARAYMMLWL